MTRSARVAHRPHLPRRGAAVAAVAALLAVAAGSFRGPEPLAQAHETPDALARAVLAGFERRDAGGLRALALSEAEFRERVWPELPAARPERNLPLSYVWEDLRQKSEAHLARSLEAYGGRSFDLVRLSYGRSSRYGSYLVHRETVLTVRERGGAEQRIRLYGSTLEARDGLKVLSYIVPD